MVDGRGWLYLDEHLDATSQILSHHIRVESLDLPLHKPLGVAVRRQPGLRHLLLPRSLGGARGRGSGTGGPFQLVALPPRTSSSSPPKSLARPGCNQCPHGRLQSQQENQ